MLSPAPQPKTIYKDIALLKSDIAELEEQLKDSAHRSNSGSLKSIAVRVLISAQRVEDLVSQISA